MGRGEPLMVVHGGPVLDHSYLAPYLKPLAEKYMLVFYDQRVSGRSSSKADSSSIRLDTMVEDIATLKDSLDIGKMHLLGHSWGGLLAMKYAIKYPSSLYSLILSNSMPASSELWRKEEKAIAGRTTTEDSLARERIMSTDSFANNNPETIEKLLLISFKKQFYDTGKVDRLDFHIPGDYVIRSRKFGHIMKDLVQYDLHHSLKSLKLPTLLIYGAVEPATSISGPRLDSTLPESKFVTVDSSGHFPFVERPGIFTDTVVQFLDSH